MKWFWFAHTALIRPCFQLQQAAHLRASRSATSSRRCKQLAVEHSGAFEIESAGCVNHCHNDWTRLLYVRLLFSAEKEAALCSHIILSVWINMQHLSLQLCLKGHFFASVVKKESWVVTCNQVQHNLKKKMFSIRNNGPFSWRPFWWYTVARSKSHPQCYYVTAALFMYSEAC